MIIGITGGTGCGKTTLLKEIEARGGLVLDATPFTMRCCEQTSRCCPTLKPGFPAL